MIIRNQDNLASFWCIYHLLRVLPFQKCFSIVPINKYIVLCEIFWNTPYLKVYMKYSKQRFKSYFEYSNLIQRPRIHKLYEVSDVCESFSVSQNMNDTRHKIRRFAALGKSVLTVSLVYGLRHYKTSISSANSCSSRIRADSQSRLPG